MSILIYNANHYSAQKGFSKSWISFSPSRHVWNVDLRHSALRLKPNIYYIATWMQKFLMWCRDNLALIPVTNKVRKKIIQLLLFKTIKIKVFKKNVAVLCMAFTTWLCWGYSRFFSVNWNNHSWTSQRGINLKKKKILLSSGK